ncbi:MAG: replication-associated recombination protein A [Armatimonadetes bacterium]|nr:replication-associated recombination protein A [Armatimonadota bacterium]
MRPRTLDEFVGQGQLLGPGSVVSKAILEGKLGSVVLWAPPGCGKTTLAHIIGHHAGAVVEVRSAVTAGVADVRKIAEAARERLRLYTKPTLLLLDEIHHFNKSQQDSLLGYLEDGVLSLVGATTENPFFALNPALLSRARVLPLKPLEPEDVRTLLSRALADEARGLGERHLKLTEDAEQFLVHMANGDARLALNALESASLLVPESGGEITLDTVEQVLQRQAVRYDRQGDYHYDTISAFIKSVRGSDSDAALHYLARMIQAGEDPRFIMRRLLVLASEDIGNAEPMGIVVAAAGLQAVSMLGMPESRITLAQVTTFLAEAPKSNRSYLAIEKALADAESRPLAPIPMHLRNAPTKGMEEFGHGKGYQYPHDFEGAWVEERYLPEGEYDTPYYEPSERGHEAKMNERRQSRKKGRED